jgi:hypothetical protein
MAKMLDVSCPQCGSDTPSSGRVATTCRHCETLLVLVDGGAKRAQAFDGHLPRDGSTVALICRFCAGALPDGVLKLGSGARCDYCGQPPALPPTLLALLKVMVTHPTALPPAAKYVLRVWLTLCGVFALLVGLYAWMPDSSIHSEEYIALENPRLEREEAGKKYYALQVRSQTLDIRPRGNGYPNLSLQAWDFVDGKQRILVRDQRVRFLVTVVRENTGERRSQWVTIYDGARWRPSSGYPDSHPYDAFYFGDAKPISPGRYHLEISQAVAEGGPLPPKLEVEWNTSYSNMNLWFILAVNLGLWLFIFDLRASARHTTGPQKLVNIRRLVAVLALALTLVEIVHPFNPFGTKGVFTPKEAAPK